MTVPHKVQSWHPVIERLLKEDEDRRKKQLTDPYPTSWDKPLYDTPFEKRRLRILNALFFAAGRANGKPSVYKRETKSATISFYEQHVNVALDRPKETRRRGARPPGPDDTSLSLSILESPNSEKTRVSWQDDEGSKLEAKLTEIAIEVVLTAEIKYRDWVVRQYQWRVERKAQLEEEVRQCKIRAERAELERQKKIEQARIDRLLRDASAFHQAGEIRKYVEEVVAVGEKAVPSSEIERWRQWALAQADRIDPVVSGSFLKAIHDEDASK